MLKAISEILGEHSLNIENMTSKSRGNYAYVIVDVSDTVAGDEISEQLYAIDGIIKVRVI